MDKRHKEPAYGRSHFERRLKRANAEMDKLLNMLHKDIDTELGIEVERKISIVAYRVEYLENMLREPGIINPKFDKANRLSTVPNSFKNTTND